MDKRRVEMGKYLVQKIPYHNVEQATVAINKIAAQKYDVFYVHNDGGKLIVLFQKRLGRPKKTGK